MKTLILAAAIVLTGCVSTGKLQNSIQTQRQQLQNMLLSIDSLDKKRSAKFEKGELDEKTDSITRHYISDLKDSISKRLQRFDALEGIQSHRSNKKATIEYLNAVKDSYKKELENIIFFDDLFDATTFSRLNTAAFFAPGQYMPTTATYEKAKIIMGQLISDALQFSDGHSSRKLKVFFIVTGYADEEDVAPGSELYQSLVQSVSPGSLTRKQLNRELSLRRAYAIKDILEHEYYLLSKDKASSNLTATFLSIGKGEELPRSLQTDYKPIDERRRVVLLYWSILPAV